MARHLLIGTALQTGLTFMAAVAAAQPVPNARPGGVTVVAGSAAISRTAHNTRIDQSSQRAAIDWRSFDVGSAQSVTFQQPNAQAVALNRVEGPDPSQIAGRIDANGQIVLVNQSGVNFYRGAQVNAAGVMVSAAGMSNASVQSFIKGGRLALDRPAHAGARIDNAGTITVRQAGLAALVAPQVANSGTISAQLGHVVLAGAKTATLDLYGDGLLSLDVSNQVTEAPAGPDGRKATALVTNTGVVVADGGTVQLTARAADGIVQNLVQAGGRIRAATMGDRTGTIALDGVGGSIVVAGQLSAAGRAPGTRGGAIGAVSDGDVILASTARINASGKAGGGTVAIGTSLARAQDGPGVTGARIAGNTTIRHGATIRADATASGKGGRVAVLSDRSGGTTRVDGAISARGGPKGGDGGFVETSGFKLGVGSDAAIDVGARAPAGQPGTWLLDPFDITIDVENVNTSESGGTFTASKDPATIANLTVDRALIGGNVVVSTGGSGTDQGNITVAAPVQWANGNSLTLRADNDIAINSSITGASGGLILSAGNTTKTGSITIAAPIGVGTMSATSGAAGSISESPGSGEIAGGQITTTGLLTTKSGTGTTLDGDNAVASFNAVNTGSGNIVLANTAETLTITGISQSGGGVSVANTGGALMTSGPINAGAGAVALTTIGGLLTVGAPVSGGAITLSNGGGDIDLSANLTGTTVTLNTTEFGSVSQTGGTLTAGTLSGNIANELTLLQPTNAVSSLGNLTLGSDGSLADSVPLTIAGTVNTSGNFLVLSSTSSITETATGSIVGNLFAQADGDVSLTAHNSITLSDGIVSKTGNVAVVNDTDLTLVGSFSGKNLFFEVASKGGKLTLSDGDPRTESVDPAALTATGRISLVADHMAVESEESEGLADTRITAPTVELAPFTPASSTSLLSGGGLVIDPTLLSIIHTDGGTLEVGGFTNLPAGASAPAANTAAIDIGAPLDLSGKAGTLRLDANGAITQSGGPLKVGTLTGTGKAWELAEAANSVATLGNVGATSFDLHDSTDLAVAGTLLAPAAASIADAGALTVSGQVSSDKTALTATGIIITGSVTGTSTLTLTAATGAIDAAGVLLAGDLSGGAAGAASMTGANRIAQLGPFTASGLVLNDTIDLLLASTLTAGNIGIDAPGRQITLGDGASIVTGGTTRPAGPLDPALEPGSGTAPGAFFNSANFRQIGSGTVAGQGGSPATLRIATTNVADFDPPAGLSGIRTWLILDLNSGTATGNVFVDALDVTYAAPGGSSLTGTIAGIEGGPAAAVGHIQPAIDAHYLFNGCIIAAAECGPPSLPPPPPPSPPPPPPSPPRITLTDSEITSALGGLYPFLPGSPPPVATLPKLVLVAVPLLRGLAPQLTDTDVVPPNISYLDY
ncbi:MAG TPA: filamentous hemagglutinin N-terminal domain-containing protein [Acetobacteraceae bacterium]